MRKITVVFPVLLLLAIPAGVAIAQPARPTLHEEAGRLLDQVADGLRSLRVQIEQHLHSGRGGIGPGMGPGGPMPGGTERPLITIMLQYRNDLGLTPEQVSRLEALRSDFAREAIRRGAEIRIAELDLASLLEQDPVDMAKVEAKIREAAQLRADLRVARLRTIEQGKTVLTADQKAKLQTLLVGGMGMPRRAGAAGVRL